MNDRANFVDETSFWRKIRRFAFKAGQTVVEKALVLFFCLKDRDTPVWARTVIVGALAYFVLPLDALPDLLPGVGYTDDLGVLLTALTTVLAHVKPVHRERARELLEWKWANWAQGQGGAGRQKPPEKDPQAHHAAVLGVEPDSPPDVIRERYRELVKQYHPDRVEHLGAEFRQMADEKLKAINAAYEHFKAIHPGGLGTSTAF